MPLINFTVGIFSATICRRCMCLSANVIHIECNLQRGICRLHRSTDFIHFYFAVGLLFQRPMSTYSQSQIEYIFTMHYSANTLSVIIWNCHKWTFGRSKNPIHEKGIVFYLTQLHTHLRSVPFV